MKRTLQWSEQADVILSNGSSSSDADIEVDNDPDAKKSTDYTTTGSLSEEIEATDVLKKAAMYQEYMKHLSVPTPRGSVIPFTTWMGLAKSIKQLYGQPLHYLTNLLLKKWDLLRIGTDDEQIPLDTIIHPCKAEANIWLTEEVHRRTASPHFVAELWVADPTYHIFVDPIFPKICSRS